MTDAISTIRVGGSNRATPGGYSEADTSAAEIPALVDGGVVALIGDAIGGKPGDVLEFTSLDAIRSYFTEKGSTDNPNITFYAGLLYNSNADSRITGRPSKVYIIKTNQDTQSEATMQGATGGLIDLTSVDYGGHTNQINYSVSASTTGIGRDIIIQYAGKIEAGENIGGETQFQIEYVGPAEIWTLLTVDPSSADEALLMKFNYNDNGENGASADIKPGWIAPSTATVTCASSDDDYQEIEIYGLDSSNIPAKEVLTLNGSTQVGSTSFNKVTAAIVKGVTHGNVTVSDGSTTVATFSTELFAATMTAGKVTAKSDTTDVGQAVIVTGIQSGTGVTITNTMILNGTTRVESADSFEHILSVQVSGTTTGNTIIEDVDPKTLLTLASAVDPAIGVDNSLGLYRIGDFASIDGTPTVSGVAGTDVILRGVASDGTAYVERFTGVGPTVGSAALRELTWVELGGMLDTDSVSVIFDSFKHPGSYDLATSEGLIADLVGMTAISFNDTRLWSEMDYMSAPIDGGSPSQQSNLFAQKYDMVEWINTNSGLVTAEALAGVYGPPNVTLNPVFLTGAVTAVSTNQDFFNAFDKLKAKELSIIIPLTEGASIHSYGVDHCEEMDDVNERAMIVGIGNGYSKDEVRTLTRVINSEHVGAVSQKTSHYDEFGEVFECPTYGTACVGVGQRAKSPIGEPLTWKLVDVLGISEESWDPVSDSEDMLRRGLMFLRYQESKGYYWVRSITTYQKSANKIYTEQSSMESLQGSKRDLRNFLADIVVGRPNVLFRAATIKKLAEGRLRTQAEELLIAAYANITVTKVGDLTTVEYDCAPTEPNNFVRVKVHVQIFTEEA
jgi:hypothetical protein